MLCTKDRADKFINRTANKLTLVQMKKKMDNLPDEIIDFDISNIQVYVTNEAWETLQQLGKVTLHFNHTIINTTPQ